MESINYMDESCRQFVARLATKAPTPGGGGASALCGALGIALGNMVIELTLGKKKYAGVEAELLAVRAQTSRLQERLLSLVAEDAQAFAPLAEAYALPSNTLLEQESNGKIMEMALCGACQPPLEIMRVCADAIRLLETIADKGSVMALSDAGAGMRFCMTAMESASLNIFINTKSMKNRAVATDIEADANELLVESKEIANRVISAVDERLKS